MYDVHVIFSDRPGELARFGQLLGRHGVGLEGGGVFGTDAHFLVGGRKSLPRADGGRIYRSGGAQAGYQKTQAGAARRVR